MQDLAGNLRVRIGGEEVVDLGHKRGAVLLIKMRGDDPDRRRRVSIAPCSACATVSSAGSAAL